MRENKEESFVSAVVYFHNHASFAEDFIRRLSELLRTNFLNYEIVCVDDGSSDDTISALHRAAGETGRTARPVSRVCRTARRETAPG